MTDRDTEAHGRGERLLQVAVVIPTFNEPEDLAKTVASVKHPTNSVGRGTEIFVVNAGSALPSAVSSQVRLLEVPHDTFWTGCIEEGLKAVVATGRFSHVMLLNADTPLMPGSMRPLLSIVEGDPTSIACSPAYRQVGDEAPEILYSHESQWGWLLVFWLERAWRYRSDAPKSAFETRMMGGQGVLFAVEVLKLIWPDSLRFPHYMGDTDLWLQAKRAGFSLIVVPDAGVVNIRPFRHSLGSSRIQRIRSIWWKFTSDRSLDSFIIMWRLRRKHLPLPVAVASFAIVVPWRMTYGAWNLLRHKRHL